MANITDLAVLSDQVELNQAMGSMLRIKDLSEELHRVAADDLDHSWPRLDERNEVLQEPQQ